MCVWRSISICVATAGAYLATGCSIHIPTIESDAIDYNHAIENMSNEVALLNVLRAKEGLPRHYTSISAIQGDLEFTAAGEIGSVLQHGSARQRTTATLPAAAEQLVRTTGADTYSPKISASVATSPNFTVSVLETDEFYKGILGPIKPEIIATYVSQGWSGPFLAHTLIEAIEFDFADGAVARFENDHRGDSLWKRWAGGIRLTVRAATPQANLVDEFSGPLTPEQISALYRVGLELERCDAPFEGAASCRHKLIRPGGNNVTFRPIILASETHPLSGEADDAIVVFSAEGAGAEKLEKYRSEVLARLKEPLLSGDPGCGTVSTKDHDARQAPWTTLSFDPLGADFRMPDTSMASQGGRLCIETVRIVPRSTDGVIYFVGEYLRYLEGREIDGACRPDIEVCIASSNSHGASTPLFRLRVGRGARREEGVSVSATVGSKRYWVEREGTHRSMQVLGLIQQLTNLHKKASAMPQPTFIQTR